MLQQRIDAAWSDPFLQSALTVVRNEDYRTEVQIWRDAAEHRPDNWRAHATLSSALFREQRIAEGIAALEVALKVNPTEAKLHNNYANALALPMVGRWAEAVAAGGVMIAWKEAGWVL